MTAPISGIGQGLRAPQAPGAVGDVGAIQVPVLRDGAAAPSFGDVLTNALNQVSETVDRSRDYTQAFLRGEPVELHQVMAAAEEAGISIDLLIQVRNKVLEAYRTVMSMTT
jgi:flagellar hook-basal body complex protein FliE